MLAALKQTGGRLISIDCYMHSLKWGEPWNDGMVAALHAIERGGYTSHHRHIHAKSCDALPRLLAEKVTVQMAYIDGAHDFGNCFVDYFYLDKILDLGGILAFNDAGWLSVWSVIKYLEHGGRYHEIDVGLRRRYAGRNPAITSIRWLGDVQRQDRYFRKARMLWPD